MIVFSNEKVCKHRMTFGEINDTLIRRINHPFPAQAHATSEGADAVRWILHEEQLGRAGNFNSLRVMTPTLVLLYLW